MVGHHMPHRQRIYKNLPPEWTDFKTGSLIVEANNEEATYKYIEPFIERDGSMSILAHDSDGHRRYFRPDAIRLASIDGRGRQRGRKGPSLLSDAEQKLSRAEKRRLRRERRDGGKEKAKTGKSAKATKITDTEL